MSEVGHILEAMLRWIRNARLNARMDAELREIISEHERVRESATAIRDFLLRVLDETQSGGEKFSDEALADAAELIEELGPGAFYWMTEIAVQMTLLAQASLADIPTNVSVELGKSGSAEQIVKLVVQV
jgi:gamma-glutamyltranspeptidase